MADHASLLPAPETRVVLQRVRLPEGTRRTSPAVQDAEIPDQTEIDLPPDVAFDDDQVSTIIRPETPRPPRRLARSSSVALPRRQALSVTASAKIGKYTLGRLLGSGAFGAVFAAKDPNLDREVAIKVLHHEHGANPRIIQRFLQEAKAAARIQHPGIVTVHDCGIDGETAFIVMELLDGESLTGRLGRQGRMTPEAAMEIARQTAAALEAAHRAGVIHRDLKPDNIFLVPDPAAPTGERVKVLDFGLARQGLTRLTLASNVFGTPRYMAPEQSRSATHSDRRSDIYALGCILYELVTNRPPFDGGLQELVEQHQHAVAPRARLLEPSLSPVLDQLIATMLEKDADLRPQTMGVVQLVLAGAGAKHAGPGPTLPLVVAPVDVPDPPVELARGSSPRPALGAAPQLAIVSTAPRSGGIAAIATRSRARIAAVATRTPRWWFVAAAAVILGGVLLAFASAPAPAPARPVSSQPWLGISGQAP